MKKIIIVLILITSTTSYNAQSQTTDNIKSFISIVEIPATDISRAVGFYQSILSTSIDVIDMQGMQMGLFPSEGQAVSVVITQGEGYEPSSQGVLVYLNGGNDLQLILDKIEKSGGQIVMPKTLIDEENGYFALFLDSEGNRLGLHSLN
ncbi:VOC family protein [Reichenbachiella ulvae]|uniref:VOC family protein n=1 Tax=Reichenbachiella ulvae TaxID=2980104 RepID=A0ABT3CX30_9BACT|nr:VOC family protein [Reichenbachiella ulvae]MCV9387763.1 VOC family protein [Reichenbachiella ulvae]